MAALSDEEDDAAHESHRIRSARRKLRRAGVSMDARMALGICRILISAFQPVVKIHDCQA
jgi:hypothetical protein